MKFTEHLSAHITPEWRKQYIQYEAFKEMLYAAQDQAPSIEVTDEDTVKRYYAKFEEKFFQTCEKELAKINTFYSEASRGSAAICHAAELSCSPHWTPSGRAPPGAWPPNYQNLNFTGFRKILKKHDKILETTRGADWRVAQKAMKRLRVPPLGAAQPAPAWTTFRVGLYCGVFLVLMVTVVITGVVVMQKANVWPLIRIYRGGFLLIEFLFLLGINTYGWRQAGVNHVLIFELNPRNNLSHQHLFEIAGLLGVLWCISLLCCLFSDSIFVPMQANPLFRVVTAPFHRVEFADFWLADQLNSLVVVLMDLEYMVCFYSFELDWHRHDGLVRPGEPGRMPCHSYSYGIRAVIQCLPAWFRFIQCLRPQQPAEAQVFFYLLIGCSLVSSCYTLIWDLKMDWGLFDRGAGENTFLREEIVYPQKAYYYSAILEDVLLRFSWTLTNEHLNNCGEFRAVRDISVAPLNADDQTLLEQMMDQEDGVRNRQGKRSWKRSYS
ncbi:hypothetical protein CRUP_024172, partial [Coryphaenoides rupestris]